MSKQLDNQIILKRIQKYSEKGVTFNFNTPSPMAPIAHFNGGGVLMTAFEDKESMLKSHVKMTDPNIHQRVSVHVEIYPEDELKDLDFKLDLVESLFEQAKEINKHKEKLEELEKKQNEERIAQAKARHELNKKSPILFDFLYANTFQEEQAQQGIFPIQVQHVELIPAAKSKPAINERSLNTIETTKCSIRKG